MGKAVKAIGEATYQARLASYNALDDKHTDPIVCGLYGAR